DSPGSIVWCAAGSPSRSGGWACIPCTNSIAWPIGAKKPAFGARPGWQPWPIASPAVREVLWGYPRAFVDRHRGDGSRSAGNPSELERPEQASNGGANRRHQAYRAEQDIAAKLVQDEVAGNDRSRKNELPIGDCPYGTRLAECKACDQASCDRCQQNDDGPKEHVGRIDQYEAGSLQWHDHQQGY